MSKKELYKDERVFTGKYKVEKELKKYLRGFLVRSYHSHRFTTDEDGQVWCEINVTEDIFERILDRALLYFVIVVLSIRVRNIMLKKQRCNASASSITAFTISFLLSAIHILMRLV